MRKIVKEENYDICITLNVVFVIENFEIRNLINIRIVTIHK